MKHYAIQVVDKATNSCVLNTEISKPDEFDINTLLTRSADTVDREMLGALIAADKCLTELYPFGQLVSGHEEEQRAVSMARTKIRAAISRAEAAKKESEGVKP